MENESRPSPPVGRRVYWWPKIQNSKKITVTSTSSIVIGWRAQIIVWLAVAVTAVLGSKTRSSVTAIAELVAVVAKTVVTCSILPTLHYGDFAIKFQKNWSRWHPGVQTTISLKSWKIEFKRSKSVVWLQFFRFWSEIGVANTWATNFKRL